MDDVEVLDSEQVAVMLGVERVTVQRLAKAGKLPAARVGKKWVFFRHVLEEWLEKRMRENVRKKRG